MTPKRKAKANPETATRQKTEADAAKKTKPRRQVVDASSRLPDWSVLPAHLVALVVTPIAVIWAPRVDHDHPAKDLVSFFSSVAQVAVTLLVAVALFQGALGSSVAQRARRWLGRSTFVYLGAATVAGVIASSAAVEPWIYRWLFGLCIGFGGAGLLTVLLVGASNIAAQRDEEIAARAGLLGQSSASDAAPTGET